jgi:8-oxo-dGTP diphosphatase
MVVNTVLCEIVKNGRILLQKKAEGKFGAGKWNGVGGKIKPDETSDECVVREVFEETGLKISNQREIGLLNFYFGDRYQVDIVAHVFLVGSFSGIIKASEEGELHWFRIDEVPYGEMWQDDTHWFPLMLSGKRFEGRFYFDEEGKKLIDFDLKEKL